MSSPAATAYDNKAFTIALGLFVLLLAVYSVLQSPLFSLKSVELRGAERLTPDDILAAGGLRLGDKLFSINLRDLARALEQNPLVEEVRLGRRIPGTLKVAVVERRPVAYLSAENGIWAVDARGIPLFAADRLSMAIPVVTAEPPVAPQAGVRVEHANLEAALRFIEALSVKSRSGLSEVHAGPGGVTAYSRDRLTIALGLDADPGEQARVLEALLEKIEAERLAVSRIDLSRPKAPVIQE